MTNSCFAFKKRRISYTEIISRDKPPLRHYKNRSYAAFLMVECFAMSTYV